MKTLIYADNAATTRLDEIAFEAMKPFLLGEFANVSQPYAFARVAKKALRESREIIANCIGAEPGEIFFTSGGTESDNWVIKGTALASSGKTFLASAFEHHAVLRSMEAIGRIGCPVKLIKPDNGGSVTAEILSRHLAGDIQLVSVMLANNELGTIQPVKELCSIAHEHGALFHTDAVQAIGHILVDAHDLGIDFLSASAHKFNGPKGIGFLYVRKGVKFASLMNGGAQENGLRAGTENIAGIVGMAKALEINCRDMERNMCHLAALETTILERLDSLGVSYILNGETSLRLPGFLSLSFPGADGEALLHRLDLCGICVSTGAACDSHDTQISHVLKAIGLDEKYARGTIRITFSKDSTIEDAETVAKAIGKIIG